jgi:HD-like signal output (HDOD) protein/DNA-binding CsgD family transcriptional regulator
VRESALEMLESCPVSSEARSRALHLLAAPELPRQELATVLESDIGLTAIVLGLANTQIGQQDRRVETLFDALKIVRPESLTSVVGGRATFDPLASSGDWLAVLERSRLHAVATQQMARRIADELDYPEIGRLLVTSLVHDIGELALAWMSPEYLAELISLDQTREEQLKREKQRFGVTHARAGALCAKCWGLPSAIWRTIDRHHQQGPTGEAAIIRLADLLAHHAVGDGIAKREAVTAARDAGLGTAALWRLLYELPVAGPSERRVKVAADVLSRRELDVLRRLAQGMSYASIAADLRLSPSTVRAHLHNLYKKLGVSDRAQAALFAARQGWI